MFPIETWAAGYAQARGYPPPVATDFGLWMPVGLPGQVGRHVLAGGSPERLAEVVAAIDGPDVFIEVCRPRPAVAPLIPPGWIFRDPAFLMDRRLAPAEPAPPLDGYVLQLSGDGPIRASLHAPDGALAASGAAGLVGETLVFDQIVTVPEHRRRGLATRLLAALTDRGLALGAREGVLIATPEGLALYLSLGWRELSSVTSVISGPRLDMV